MTDPGLLAGKLFNPLNNICGQNAAQGDFGALWGCFGTGLVINLVLCIIAFVLAEPLLKGFFGGYFEAVKVSRPHHALSLAMEVVVLTNATVVVSLVFYEKFLLHTIAIATPAVAFELPARASLWLATGALIGYMLWHGFMLLYHRQLMEKTMGTGMYMTMLVHHFCSIFMWPVSLRTGYACYFVAMFVASEASSIPLAFRTFGLRMGPPFTSSLWFRMANLTWLVVWAVVRVGPIPSMLNTLAVSNWAELDAITYAMSWFVYVPLLMNTVSFHEELIPNTGYSSFRILHYPFFVFFFFIVLYFSRRPLSLRSFVQWWTWLIVKSLYKQCCSKSKKKKIGGKKNK
jgi:hypothetical protein